MKKKLLVILGAGSSVEQGFPSTEQLNMEVAKWALEHAKIMQPNLSDLPSSKKPRDFYGLLWKNRADYCLGLTGEEKEFYEHRTAPNYERVLGDLHVLMNSALGKPYGDPILQWVTKASVFEDFEIASITSSSDDSPKDKNFFAVLGQLKSLSVHLANKIRGASALFEIELGNGRGTKAFEPYKQLFAALSPNFEIGMYNLNYDTVALNALPSSFVGFDRHTGDFLSSDVLLRRDWDFIYHLHGSVHHRITREDEITEEMNIESTIKWYDDFSQVGDVEDWDDVGDLKTATDGKRLLPSSFVTGGWKLDQLQEEPFNTLYSCLPRHSYESDAILICGYGFQDPHINSILKNTVRTRSKGKPRPPVLVIDFDENARPIAKRCRDPWTTAMCETLRVSPQTFRETKQSSEVRSSNMPGIDTLRWSPLVGQVDRVN